VLFNDFTNLIVVSVLLFLAQIAQPSWRLHNTQRTTGKLGIRSWLENALTYWKIILNWILNHVISQC